MLNKLALRNVRRQIGNYLIYFITVSLTVALMFAINNVIFSKELLAFAQQIKEFNSALIFMSVFIALIVAFILGYASSFMLRLRKREFGTYLTLGMTRKNLLTIFLTENLALCGAALLAGIGLGLFVYQGLMAVVSSLMEMETAFASYSSKGFALTTALVCGMFLLSTAASALYLKKAKIYDLIHGGVKNEKTERHPLPWFCLALLSLGSLIWSAFYLNDAVKRSFENDPNAGRNMLLSIVALSVSLVLLHIGAARGLVGMLLKRKRFCSRGTNAFTLRQLSAKLSANAVMAGILAFLIAFAVIGSNLSFVQKISAQLALDNSYPFDITAIINPETPTRIPLEQGRKIISQFQEIRSVTPYHTYTSGRDDLYRNTRWSGEGYEGMEDSFLPLSEFNALMRLLGRDPVELNGEYLIGGGFYTKDLDRYDFSKTGLTLNGKTYRYKSTIDDLPRISWAYFIAVVPDEAIKGMKLESECAAIDLVDGKFDANAMQDALYYQFSPNAQDPSGAMYNRCDYSIREQGRIQQNSISAVFVVGALYISVVFVFMAMAVLALKTLAGLSEDQQRYRILFRLGAGRKEQCKALFRQTFSFFFLPFALPILLSIPTAFISAQIMEYSGILENTRQLYRNAGLIALVLTAVYTLYFTATYLIARRNVVTPRS